LRRRSQRRHLTWSKFLRKLKRVSNKLCK
jgi:hypothetical protein